MKNNMIQLLTLSPDAQNCGYFYEKADGTLDVVGFEDIWHKLVRFSELDGAVILAHDDEEIPPEECIMLDEESLANRNVKKYLKERNAINCIFTKIFGIYSQSGVRVLQYFKPK